jgi:hypothetical protein
MRRSDTVDVVLGQTGPKASQADVEPESARSSTFAASRMRALMGGVGC